MYKKGEEKTELKNTIQLIINTFFQSTIKTAPTPQQKKEGFIVAVLRSLNFTVSCQMLFPFDKTFTVCALGSVFLSTLQPQLDDSFELQKRF